jgi:enoyl-[acyl-carrier protein] reductase I
MSNNLLKEKRGIITGALDSNSIAWKVAERCHEEGATFVLSNAPVALRLGAINQLAQQCNSEVIAADVTKMADIENLYTKATETLGGKIDFLLHSIGMSPNVRKGKSYTQLDYDFYHKTLDISAMSLHRMLQAAQKADAIAEGGSVVALSYIAAQRVFPDYSDMADAKSLLESITRSYGYHLGKSKRIRINTISQSPTKTTAGSGVKGFDSFFDYANAISPLGNADALSCADYCVTLFSDLTRMVTMQNLFHDGGFSFTGISSEVMEMFSKE